MTDKNRELLKIASGKRKVAVIGVGFVGASIAYSLTVRNIAREIVLIDKDVQKAEGEALDIRHGIPYIGASSVYVGDYADCADCDLIIICAGRNRKVGENRLDLASGNIGIIRDVIRSLSRYYSHGAIMIVSNPIDILTYTVDKMMELPNGMVFGTGCILDTSRLTSCIADYISLNTEVVKGFMVGEHGDAQIPIWSRLSIAGVPMDEYCETVGLPWGEREKAEMYSKVKNMGAQIIRNKGKTHYGIATCVCYLASAVLNQRLTIVSVSTTLQGEYGVRDTALSVPSIVGVNGVERRLEERWSDEEFAAFKESAKNLREFLRKVHS